MATKKETSTARLFLGTNASKEMIFLLIEGQPNQITKETEKAICYHGYAKWLSSTERMIDMWIPKSLSKIEDRTFETGNAYKCLIVPSWFYNKFLQEKNIIDFH